MAGGEYFIVRYFLTLSIKIIDGGRGGNNTLANGNLRKYYLQEHTHPLQGSCAGNTFSMGCGGHSYMVCCHLSVELLLAVLV